MPCKKVNEIYYGRINMFKTFKSSAGSGKTTHLVAEYLTICFRSLSGKQNRSKFKNILAITFTNNATAEMKERILKTLHFFAFSTDYTSLPTSFAAILKMIKENLQPGFQCDDEFIREQSRWLLHDILYDYSNFSVSTIDSFFQRLIKAFAIDMNLNMNFNLEINNEELYSQTIDILLNKASEKEKESSYSLSYLILQLMIKGLEDKGKNVMEKELSKILNFAGNEEAHEPLLKLQQFSPEEIKENCKSLISKNNRLKREIISIAEKGDALIKGSTYTEQDFCYGKTGPYYWFYKMRNCPQKIPAETRMQGIVEKGSLTKDPGLLNENDHQQLIRYYHQIIELHAEYRFLNILAQNLNSYLLLFDLQQIMEEIKIHDNLFLLSDANSKIHDAIKDEEAPYIYEKIGNRYSYFLIDEFQDTSKMQWENLLPLIKNALAGSSGFGELGEAALFGDVKQAIYRFRNGDSWLFNTLSNEEGFKKMMQKASLQEGEYENISLDTNYRSREAVVSFNNHFFEFLRDRVNDGERQFALAEEYYRDVVQKYPQNSTGRGFVKIRFEEDSSSENYLQEEVEAAVRDAVSKGFQHQDIAILTRGRESGNELGRYLTAKGIPVISSDSILLKSSKEVRVLIATLQYLADQQNQVAKLLIVHYLIEKSSPVTMEEALSRLSQETDFRALLKEFQITIPVEHYRSLPLFSLLKELVLLYQIDSDNLFIINLLDYVLDYISKNNAEITSFLDWWEKRKDQLSVMPSKGINAVTITTVHKSKGLQYPVVIFPSKRYSDRLTKDRFWFDYDDEAMKIPSIPVDYNDKLKGTLFEEKYQEERNLTAIDNLNIIYVAHTRAIEGLYIITGKKESGNYAAFLSDFIAKEADIITEDAKNENLYWLGDAGYHHQGKVNETDGKPLSNFQFSDFLPHAIPRLSPSTDLQKRGINVHHYLSSLVQFPQTEEEIMTMRLPEDEIAREHVIGLLRQIMQDEEILPYFSNKAKTLNEISIIDQEGRIHRPDRVAILGDRVTVIDYKTGKPNASYQKQIEKYVELLREMGYYQVKGKVLYSN